MITAISPDPDLVPLTVDAKWLDEVRAQLPELPDAKSKRFQEEFGLPRYDAEVLTAEKELAAYFDKVVGAAGKEQAKAASNWVMGDVLRLLNERKITIEECPIPPERLARMILLIDDGTISGKIAKTVFDQVAESGKDPETIVEEKGLRQITDTSAIESVVEDVIASNPEEVEAYRGGKTKLMGFFVGQAMKATGGKANPKALQEILREKLGN